MENRPKYRMGIGEKIFLWCCAGLLVIPAAGIPFLLHQRERERAKAGEALAQPAGPAQAPDRINNESSTPSAMPSDVFLIVPGVNVGRIFIGQPVSPLALQAYGPPDEQWNAKAGIQGKDSGAYIWKDSLEVKLNDGVKDDNVFTIFITDPRYATAKNIHVDSTLEEVKNAYSESVQVEDVLGESDFGLTIKGAYFSIYQNKISQITISGI